MIYVKVECSVPRNPKFVKAGPGPSWLWLCGLCYCQQGLTDGFIPDEALDYLGVKNARGLAKHLVAAGLWEPTGGGWRVHDYLEHNRSAEAIKQIKDDKRDAGKRGGEASGRSRVLKQSASPDQNAVLQQTANPSSSSSSSSSSESATETPTRTARPQPIFQRRRLDAAWEGRRVYVPQRAHTDFVGYRGGNESELLAWYEDIDEAYAGVIDPDMFAFWRARYREKWPPTQASKARGPAWLTEAV